MARPRRFRLGFLLLGLVVVALVIWAVFGHPKDNKPKKAPVVAVAAAKATVQDVPVAVTALGSALPWQGVTIRTQVNGKLLQVPVREGSYVSSGALLAQIDPAPYRAVLMQAQGNLKRDQALLENARLDLKRFETLASQDSIALQQRDTQRALVKQDEGIVLTDQGAVAAAQVNLNWCRITSPVAGRVGVRLVDPGNIVATTDTNGIIIVNQISPIAVTFTIPESDFQRLSDASNGFTRPLATEAFGQENGADLGAGELSIADNHVDQTTGMVLMKARFPNASQRLWPSQFVNVRLTLNTLSQVIIIPAGAVNHGPKGDFAYVIGADDKVSARPITVGLSQDDIAVIKSGIQVGDTVVTDGQLSLKPGSHVRIQKPSPAKGGKGAGA
ncbi:MAG: efflux RND transporter periplasmic adaptor subunit [Caulobacteraceae bacterium]